MEIAKRKDINSFLVLVLVVAGLLVIDIGFMPWYLNHSYTNSFRAYSLEVFAHFLDFSKAYNEPKVYFIGDSVFWGNGLDEEETIPAFFEKCDGREVFNLGLSGNKVEDQLSLVNFTERDALIFFEINSYSIKYSREMVPIDLDARYNSSSSGFVGFPYLYHERQVIQHLLFRGNSKDLLYKHYTRKMYNDTSGLNEVAPNFDTPTFEMASRAIQELSRMNRTNVVFVILPAYNKTYDSSPFRTGKFIDLSDLKIPQENYLNFNHFSSKGARVIAEKLCKEF